MEFSAVIKYYALLTYFLSSSFCGMKIIRQVIKAYLDQRMMISQRNILKSAQLIHGCRHQVELKKTQLDIGLEYFIGENSTVTPSTIFFFVSGRGIHILFSVWPYIPRLNFLICGHIWRISVHMIIQFLSASIIMFFCVTQRSQYLAPAEYAWAFSLCSNTGQIWHFCP